MTRKCEKWRPQLRRFVSRTKSVGNENKICS